MAIDSKIQWTDHTWNIAVGCTKVDADCKFCYMYRESLNGTRFEPKTVRKTKTVFTMPLKIKEPSKIFVSSFTDVFHPDCDSFRHEMWDIIRKCPQHTFQILTKRPERITEHLPADWGDGWDNVWLGTSIGHEDGMVRFGHLVNVKSKTRFLSLEPLHGPVSFHFCGRGGPLYVTDDNVEIWWRDLIHWVIIGGESGNETGKYRYRPCELVWILTIITDCELAKIPVFVKQLGTHLAKKLQLKDRHGGNIDEWPDTLKIRQFPDGK